MSMQDNLDPAAEVPPAGQDPEPGAPAKPARPFDSVAYQGAKLYDDLISGEGDDLVERRQAFLLDMVRRAWAAPGGRGLDLGNLLKNAAEAVAGPDARPEFVDDVALAIGLARVARGFAEPF